MADTKVTMQDIADSLGLSRNTVSKALNGNPSVPPSTRNLIVQKAAALGYKDFAPPAGAAGPKNGGAIAFFASMMPDKNHFGSQFLTGFTGRISRAAYTLTLFILRPEDIAARVLPPNFDIDKTAGILCIELFDPRYSEFLCGMQRPVLFADTHVVAGRGALSADIVMMENRSSSVAVVSRMIKRGAASIGFIGDAKHCQSFFERWEGYCEALGRAGLKPDTRQCILDDDSAPYRDSAWILGKLRSMGKLPGAFMCANDFLAAKTLEALHRLGKSVPKDIMVAGFDNAPEYQLLSPRLTTVHIPGYEMGVFAADTMLRRIEYPDFPPSISYLQTTPQFRESTGDKAGTPDGA
jgi:LacI family transcriptional regulator